MLDKYIDFDQIAKQMLIQREDNMVALLSLTEQYAELIEDDGVTAIQYDRDPVQNSPSSDQIINKSIQRQAIKKRIDDLDGERKQFDRAWQHLTDVERCVLEFFFMRGLKKQDAIDMLCNKMECEVATVYRRRDIALKRFKCLLFG